MSSPIRTDVPASAAGHALRARGGEYALTRLRAVHIGQVVARFERSLYIRFEAEVIVCLGRATIGEGPVNLLLADGDWARITDCTLGSPVRRCANALDMANGCRIELEDAPRWRPRRLDAAALAAGATRRVALLADLARVHAPSDTLCALATSLQTSCEQRPLLQLAAPSWRELEHWLARTLCEDDPTVGPPASVARLLGLGPGLTPSGDDVLAAVLIALHALGRERSAALLWSLLGSELAVATSVLSAAHLTAAAAGQGHRAIHAVLEALCARRAVVPAIRGLAELGHSSGWDALAGMILVFRALAGTSVAEDADCELGRMRVRGCDDDAATFEDVPLH
jgi:hypothetical protein